LVGKRGWNSYHDRTRRGAYLQDSLISLNLASLDWRGFCLHIRPFSLPRAGAAIRKQWIQPGVFGVVEQLP
jgi:hypothetical protein